MAEGWSAPSAWLSSALGELLQGQRYTDLTAPLPLRNQEPAQVPSALYTGEVQMHVCVHVWDRAAALRESALRCTGLRVSALAPENAPGPSQWTRAVSVCGILVISSCVRVVGARSWSSAPRQGLQGLHAEYY